MYIERICVIVSGVIVCLSPHKCKSMCTRLCVYACVCVCD